MAFQSDVDISVPSWRNVKAEDGSQYTVYGIEVSYDCKKWMVERRFKECQALNAQLVKENVIEASLFPTGPLITLNKFSTTLIEERRRDLEIYFRRLKGLVQGNKALIKFFGLGDSSISFVPAYTRSIFIPSIWPPDGLKHVPPQVTINGQVVLVGGLAGTICTLVNDIQTIELELYQMGLLTKRIDYLERSEKRRSSILNELEASLETFGEVLQVDAIMATQSQGRGPRLFTDNILNTLEHIRKVSENAKMWLTNISEQLYSHLDETKPMGRPGGNHPTRTTSTMGEVGDLNKLKQQAEVSLALLVASQSSDERKNALSVIDTLIETLNKHITILDMRHDTTKSAELRSLKDFVLKSKTTQLQDAGNLVSQSDVSSFDDRLFSFLDTLSKLDSMPKMTHSWNPNDPNALSAVNVTIANGQIALNNQASSSSSSSANNQPVLNADETARGLFKETEELRCDLASSRIALEKHKVQHPNDVSAQNLIDRITDIQEHLVEVQYQLKTKYLPSAQAPSAQPYMSANILPAQEVPYIAPTHNFIQHHTAPQQHQGQIYAAQNAYPPHQGQPAMHQAQQVNLQPSYNHPQMIQPPSQPVYAAPQQQPIQMVPQQPVYNPPPHQLGHMVYRRPLDDEFEL